MGDIENKIKALAGLNETASLVDIRNQATGTMDLLRQVDLGISNINSQQAHANFRLGEAMEDIQALKAFGVAQNTSSLATSKITSEISTLVCKFTEDSEYLRNTTQEIASAIQRLEHATFTSQSGLNQDFREELEKSVLKIVARNFIRRLDVDSTNKDTIDIKGKGSISYNSQQSPAPQLSQSTKIYSTGGSPKYWTRKSSKAKHFHTYFGTLLTNTVTIISTHQGDDGREETKEVAHTTYKFIPATWLSYTGAILRYDAWKRWNSNTKPSPNWSLRSIHIRPHGSPIFQACEKADLRLIQKLLANGEASPFDVSPWGRNLLGCLGEATEVSQGLPMFPYLANLIFSFVAIHH